MTSRLFRFVAWPALILIGCRAAASTSTVTRHEFDSLNVELDSAFRAGSTASAVALFTPDATVSLIGLADIRGREGFAAVLTPLFATTVVADFRLTAAEIETYDTVAYERGTFIWAAAPRGQVPALEHGRYSIVRRRTSAGQWLIHRFLENLVPEGALEQSGPR
jgi:ketosteroid isomerase-like protein